MLVVKVSQRGQTEWHFVGVWVLQWLVRFNRDYRVLGVVHYICMRWVFSKGCVCVACGSWNRSDLEWHFVCGLRVLDVWLLLMIVCVF